MDLINKTFVVTGATSGIGRATAEILASQGASVIGVGRSSERCRKSEMELRSLSCPGSLNYLVCDLALKSQILNLGQEIRSLLKKKNIMHLDGLVNSAGIFAFTYKPTSEGLELQWAVNHLAPFRLTLEMLPLLEKAPTARMVTVSSQSHRWGRIHWRDVNLRHFYGGLRAYGQAKLANILFTLELNRRLGANSTVKAFAADPGLVKTDIGLKGTPWLVRRVWSLRRAAGDPPEKPAQAIVFLLTDPAIQNSCEIYWKIASQSNPLPVHWIWKPLPASGSFPLR